MSRVFDLAGTLVRKQKPNLAIQASMHVKGVTAFRLQTSPLNSKEQTKAWTSTQSLPIGVDGTISAPRPLRAGRRST